MAESADKTPADESELDEKSDVIELTDEVSSVADDDSSDDSSPDDSKTKDIDVVEGDDGDYDRQAMVKTVQMEAVDRKAVEGMTESVSAAGAPLLDDARFSPELICGPPAVLVKKWRDGLPGKVERIVGEAKPASEPAPQPAAEEVLPEAETAEMPQPPASQPQEPPPQSDGEDTKLDGADLEELDAIELDDDDVELEEQTENKQRRSTPPPEQPPATKPESTKSESKPPKNKDNDGLGEAIDAGGDDDMSGLVQELIEEEKQKKEEKRLGPRQTWFKKVFGEEYLRSVPEQINDITRREADFIEKSLRLKKNSRILDLACGFGRHSLELANRGYQMVGMDLSMSLLQRALDVAQKKSLNVKFIHGDMRELSFSQIFDGCFVWNTSLGYFDDRTNLGVLHGLYRALKVGGRLLVDVVNRDHVVQQTPTRLWWEGNGCIFLEETEFNHQTSTLEAKRSYIYEDGQPPTEHTSFIRLYSVHELRQMLHVAGFKVLEVSGDHHYKGHFLGASSPRIIILAEKRKKKRRPSKTPRMGTNSGSRTGTKTGSKS